MTKIECAHDQRKAWEFNPKTDVYSRRCVRCSEILETMTQDEVNEEVRSVLGT